MVFRRKQDGSDASVLDANREIVGDILQFLAEQQLPITPVTFELAYLRKNDCESLAARAIDGILIGGELINQAQADHIVSAYRALGGGGGAAARQDSDEEAPGHAKLRHQTLHLAELTGEAMSATGQFGRDLSQQLDEMEGGREPFAASISAMIDRTTETEQRLTVAMEKIDALNTELAAAKSDAARDSLTGLANRRGLQAHLDALDGSRSAVLAICDIDRFKAINDRHGHQVGDRVIKAVADSIAGSCEPHIVARWGGEEFVVLMEGVSLPAAADIIATANRNLQNRAFRVRDTGEALAPITLSAGVAMVENGRVEEAISAADALLYRAKVEGRDRVIWTPPIASLAA